MTKIIFKGVEIKSEYEIKPTPYRGDDWIVIDDNYDGTIDSDNRHMVGSGQTEKEAFSNYLYMFEYYYWIEISDKEIETIISQLSDD